RATFAIEQAQPVIKALSVRAEGGEWISLGRNLGPEFGLTTGIRRTGHGLPEINRWDVFWDAPLNQTNEVRRYKAAFSTDHCDVKTDGARLEITFSGVDMGTFKGSLRYTVYRGANLLRQEVIAKTEEPSVAYKYEGGLRGFASGLLPKVAFT